MYTNGLKDRFGSPLISKRDGDAIYAPKDVIDLLGRQFTLAENATGTNECNAIQFSASKVPHNIDIDEVSIPVINSYGTPLYLAAWYINIHNVKTYIGMSDNAVAWQAGTNATWNFKTTPLNVPDDCNLELFLTATAPAIGATEIGGGWVQINCYVNYSGSGKIRYGNDWYEGRDVLVYLRQTGHIADSSHLNEAQQTAVQKLVNGDFLSKDDESVVKKNYIRESYDLEYCPDTAEVNGISLSSLYIPHNRTINKVSVLAKDMNLDTPLYLYVYTVTNGTKTRVGLSDEAILWTTDELVTWSFNQNPITIPDGANIEMYLVENEEAAAGLNEPHYPSRHIKIACKNNETNAGGTRYWDKWTMNRVVYCFFTDVDYKYIENETVENTYLTKTDAYLNFATKTDVKPYDWTPDWVHAIHSTNTSTYTAPLNGWISTTHNSRNGEVFVNEQLAGYNCSSGSFTMLIREGDTINFPATANFLFAPCNAEQCDWREQKSNYDIWRNAICYDSNGTPFIQNLNIDENGNASSWGQYVRCQVPLVITKVEDEVAFNGENNDIFVCNIQSSEIVVGSNLFYGITVNEEDKICEIEEWNSNLPKLKSGNFMFGRSNLNSFTSTPLNSLTRGYMMFYQTQLASFNVEMPALVNGYNMFASSPITSFNVEELNSLSNAEGMFRNTQLTSFNTDMEHLSVATNMFANASSLTDFDANLENLKTGWYMFGDIANGDVCNLSAQSIVNIASKIKDIKNIDKNDDTQWKYDTTKGDGTVTLNGGTINYDYRGVIHLGYQEGLENSTEVNNALIEIARKGWTIYVNGELYDSMSQYNIVEGSAYIPDASSWNAVFAQSGLVVTSVHDGYGWDD